MAESIDSLAVMLVGALSVDDAQNGIKRAMLAEALLRTEGNLTQAAELLRLSRQAVQQMLIRYEMRDWASELRPRILPGTAPFPPTDYELSTLEKAEPMRNRPVRGFRSMMSP